MSKDVKTTVDTIDLDIDSWLSAPGSSNIITSTEDTKKTPNIFSASQDSLDFLDSDDKDKDKKDDDKDQQKVDDILDNNIKPDDNLDDDQNKDQDSTKVKTGRPKVEKSGLVEFLKKRIESKEMAAFDDYDEEKQTLDEYLGSLSETDVEELWKANIENIKTEIASKTPQEFYESLPEELQYAAKYVADGGRDLKGLFKVLAQVEEVRELNIEEESDQIQIVRSYLQATNFGDDSEIEEEISTWKDLSLLEKKAKQFKPKLDMLQEELVQRKLEQQEDIRKRQERAAETYMKNVFEALKPGEINGLKLDKKTQALLYTGLVQPSYDSINGRQTNLLGHLLEKYQFVEPNYGIVAEALWLLSDPDSYRNALIEKGKTQNIQKTVKALKTEQNRKNASFNDDDDDSQSGSRKLQRPKNIFQR